MSTTLRTGTYAVPTVTLADVRALNVAQWGEAKVAQTEREVAARFARTRGR